jgi:hypothetical protein
MTEREWLACANLTGMLESLDGETTSHRKLRLFAVACCGRIEHLLPDEASRQAVLMAEAYADGVVPRRDLRSARKAAEQARFESRSIRLAAQKARSAARGVAEDDIWKAAHQAASRSAEAIAYSDPEGAISGASIQAAYNSLAPLLREVFGNPFRPVSLDPAWRTPDVLALAQAAYDNRTLPAGTLEPARLALLADALEDAGCTSAEILGHLRSEGPHVRGCWAVDLALGKG